MSSRDKEMCDILTKMFVRLVIARVGLESPITVESSKQYADISIQIREIDKLREERKCHLLI